MNFRNAFNTAATFAKEHPILAGVAVGTVAAVLPVVSLTGIVCGPVIGGVAGLIYDQRKKNDGPQ